MDGGNDGHLLAFLPFQCNRLRKSLQGTMRKWSQGSYPFLCLWLLFALLVAVLLSEKLACFRLIVMAVKGDDHAASAGSSPDVAFKALTQTRRAFMYFTIT